METHNHDKLNRPTPDKKVGKLPLPSDMLVASSTRRFVAFLLDTLIIAGIVRYAAFPALLSLFAPDNKAVEPTLYFNMLGISIFMVWCTYVVLFNASPLRATIGQRIMNIYVCTIFGAKLSLPKAFIRYLLLAFPALVIIIGGAEELLGILPIHAIIHTEPLIVSDFFYPMLMGALLLQFVLIWPLLAGNFHRVLWDDVLHCCVLQRHPRNIAS